MLYEILGTQPCVSYGDCYPWQQSLIAVHTIGDALKITVCFSIPIMLLYFVRQRQDVPFRDMFLLFGAFILACGVSHLLENWTFWSLNYRVAGLLGAITAFISCLTLIKLWGWMPQLMALRFPEELELLNQKLLAEIEQRQRDQRMLQQVLAGTASSTGTAFFSALVENLASALSVGHVFVAEVIQQNPFHLSVLARWPYEQGAASEIYDVAHTACEQVLKTGQSQHYSSNVQDHFPHAKGLQHINAQGYVGLPLKDGQGQILGVLCICSESPIEDSEIIQVIMNLFASKAAAELQRQRSEKALQKAYDKLEQRVSDRTAELAKANAHLQRLATQTRTTASIVQQLRRSLDLSTIFSTTTAELRRALACDRVLVYRFKPDWSGYIIAETVTDDWQPCLNKRSDQIELPWLSRTLESEYCAVRLHDDGDNHLQDTHLQENYGGIYRQKIDYVSVADIYAADINPCYLELLRSLQAQAYLIVPIYVGKQLWGLLASYQNDRPRQWNPEDVQMAVQVGSQLGVAIQQTELLNQTRQQAAELRQAKESADAANRAKSDFLANMSHELRTPLNAILGFTQLLASDATLSPNHKRYVDIVNSSGEHLLALINDILEMSKIEAGRLERYDTDFGLTPFLESIQTMLGLKAQQKGLDLYLEQSCPLPIWVRTDQAKLRQVLLNLLGNAIKFTEAGYVRLRVQAFTAPPAKLSSSDREEAFSNTLCIEVEDSGPGIDPSELVSLFEPFHQTQTGIKSGQGSGLGLSISQRYVQLMGGDLTVESTVGQGTRFTITLPVLMRSQLPQAPQSSLKLSAPTPFTSRQEPYRILVAEDNPNNRMLLREYLAPLGFEIQEVDNGAAAIALWRQWRPHLIWMDIRMPKLDGQAATRRIRQIETDLGLEPTVIVALTANAFEENRQEILAAGCDHLIRKPFQADHLFAVLAQYLGMTLCGGSNPVSTQSAETATLTPEALQKMPTIWVQSLHEAACQCSDTKVNALIKEIPTAQADVAEVLSCWTNVFQFDRIVAVTTPLLSQVESLPQGR